MFHINALDAHDNNILQEYEDNEVLMAPASTYRVEQTQHRIALYQSLEQYDALNDLIYINPASAAIDSSAQKDFEIILPEKNEK
jgi:hypothetical protein